MGVDHGNGSAIFILCTCVPMKIRQLFKSAHDQYRALLGVLPRRAGVRGTLSGMETLGRSTESLLG